MVSHIPITDATNGVATVPLKVGSVELSFPAPNPGWLGELARSLREQHRVVSERPVTEVLAFLDAVNARWADPSSREREEADLLLAAATGFPRAVIGPALDHLFGGLRSSHLDASLAEELGDSRALDEWIERPKLGTRSRAFGPRLTLVVASGNVPMAAIPSIVYALVLKSPLLVKLSSDEPVLAGLYLRSLATMDAAMGRTCAAVWWPGGNEEVEAVVLPQAEAVVAFGSETTLRSLEARLPPGVRYQPHGHRVGFSLVGRERLTPAELPAIAEAVARDVAEFDQQGCVAPQRLFAERGGEVTARQLAAAIGEALGKKMTEWPRTKPPPATSAAIHQLRAAAQVRAAIDGEAALFASSGGTDWTVVLDPGSEFSPGCLYRTIIVHPVDDLDRVPGLVARLGPCLQTAAAAVDEARLARLALSLADVGVSRICPLGRTQRPASGWHPDGRPRLAELVRWVDWEPE
jgi:hypothetical protein